MTLTARPATAADIKGLHPGAEGVSYRAWVCEIDGERAGVVGLALTRPRACLFCWTDEKLRPHLKAPTVLRLLKKTEAVFKARGLPVYAIREKDEPKAEAMLTRLGFKYLDEVDGEAVFEWTPD
jgi:hypothetical protein